MRAWAVTIGPISLLGSNYSQTYTVGVVGSAETAREMSWKYRMRPTQTPGPQGYSLRFDLCVNSIVPITVALHDAFNLVLFCPLKIKGV